MLCKVKTVVKVRNEQNDAAGPKLYKLYSESPRKSMRRTQRKHIYMLVLLSRLDFCKEVMRSLWL